MFVKRNHSTPFSLLFSPAIRNGRTGKIKSGLQRRTYHLNLIGIENIRIRVELFCQGSDLNPGIFKTSDQSTYLIGLNKGFVSLYVDNNIISFSVISHNMPVGFATTVGSALVVGRSHHYFSAEPYNPVVYPLIVRCDKSVL